MSKDLGVSTSYAYYVAEGGTKTPQEYGEMLVNIDTVATRAEDAADSAAESATGALNSKNAAQTAATTATNKATEATTAATTATTKAGEASTSASTATSAKDTAVSAASTATTKATEATTAAATATSAKTDAVAANTAAQSAKTAAQTAQTGAETAAASVSASAEQIATNAEDISQLKSDFSSDVGELGTFKTYNLINPSTIQYGHFCNNLYLTISDSSNYDLAVVPVEAGKTYTLKYGDYNIATTDFVRFRFVVFSDGNSGISMINGEQVTNHGEFTVPTGAREAYITAYHRSGTTLMLIEADVPQGYIKYEPYRSFKSNLTRADITDLLKTTDNLIDPDKSTMGFIQGNGKIIDSTTYETTDFIPVNAGVTYTMTPRLRVYALFGEYKNMLSFDGTQRNTPTQITPTQDGYIRISYWFGDAVIFRKGTSTEYEPFKTMFNDGVLLNEEQESQVRELIGFSSDLLNEKKWAVCGDSFTAGATDSVFTDGKYSGAKKVYPYFIGNRTGINVLQFFAGGKTLAYPSDGTFHNSLTDPSASQYYQNIPADVDYITIYLGINDSHHENGQGGDGEDPTGIIPIGTITDNTTATYYGAWNVVLTWLITNRPFAHIGIIVSNGCDREAYRTAQLEIATKYGIPYIDLNGDSRTPVMIRSKNPNIADAVKTAVTRKQAVDYDGSQTGSVNTHPNDNAHEYESYFIENFLRTI